MAATVTADDEILQVWATFKETPKDGSEYESLRNRLVERYMPLVRYNGERIWQRLPDGVDLDDLISAGIFGLMDAIDAFDLDRGVKFETYCVPRIRGAMLDVKEVEKMQSDANAVGVVSLNKKWYETDSYKDVREIDILEDKKGEDPTRRVQKNDLMRLVTKGLNRNERLIIILYYYEELTMKEIGATLDLSESRVSQMHTSIVNRLQSQLGLRRIEFGTA